ncbi:hypothetical protein GCM10010472_02150 [Pseudonocardia halophobica]|uniref:histidine kinase n=1 Tax=Pseudonocardia halophobica TaxID=29401 RepID=A0A9W6NUR2_9PSEU|nr:GAF domain-containing sensor histidine kinase [Pseudonocardia halophobica]GLL10555.1 hypothetical protein GCM10017577_16950 [Pseudonocardia halophobica]
MTVDTGLDHEDSVALLRKQTRILEQIAIGTDLGEVLTGITATLEELLPGCRCSVLLLDPDSATLRHGAAPSLPADYSAAIDGMSIGSSAGSCGTAAYLGRVVVAEDITTDTRWASFRPLAATHGLRACWSTPIRGRSGVTGTFAVYHDEPHRPDPREERLVERVTHLASVAIDHDRLFGALTESEERFRRAFEDNATGMALATLDGALTRMNRALLDLLGQTEYELLGVRLEDLFHRRTPGDQYEATARTPDGRPLEVAIVVSPVRGPGGRPLHLSVNVLDITGRRAAESERRRRREAEVAQRAAEAANRAKTDFLTALGHELRTPLQAVEGFIEVLGTLDLSPTRRDVALGHISSAGAHILSIVDDVLDVARIEAGALPLHLHDVDLDPLVDEVFAMAESLAAGHRVVVRRVGGPVTVRADPRRVRQVLLNLTVNGIRYNESGGEVEVAWQRVTDGVLITVTDTGPGIADEHLGRLFTPFDRLGADSEEGVGLGLPLARGLAEAMHGTLDVSSTVGVGTTVSVRLPAPPA